MIALAMNVIGRRPDGAVGSVPGRTT
jgi:hypothetical protein